MKLRFTGTRLCILSWQLSVCNSVFSFTILKFNEKCGRAALHAAKEFSWFASVGGADYSVAFHFVNKACGAVKADF